MTRCDLRLSVTTIESYRLLQSYDWMTWEKFVDSVRGRVTPNEAMRAGSLVHRFAEEQALDRRPWDTYEHRGYRLVYSDEGDSFADSVAGLPAEVKADRVYATPVGTVRVVGMADIVGPSTIVDHKVSVGRKAFDLDRHLYSLQWRLYLDIFGGDRFSYRPVSLDRVRVDDDVPSFAISSWSDYTMCRYPGMVEECRRAVSDCASLVVRHSLEDACVDHGPVIGFLEAS